MKDDSEFEKITTWKPGMPWEVAIEELRRRREAAGRMGGRDRVERHHKQGKLTIRERIGRMVDKGSFFEAGPLMGKGIYDKDGDLVGFNPAAFVTGLAEIDGRPVTIGGEDFTISGGSPAGSHKDASLIMQPMSVQYGIPCVRLCDGAGASAADYQESGRMTLPSGLHWYWEARLLQEVPVVAAIMGSCAGHVAGCAMMSHFSVMVKGSGQIFPAGPPVVARAMGYDIDKDELGGTRMHVRVSGAVDNEAKDEEDCFRQVREFLSYMPDNVRQVPARRETGDDPNRREEGLLNIIPTDRKKPYDMYKLLGMMVDKGQFFEMRRHYGRALITAFARMDGYSVGILASNPMFDAGSINGKTALKMARFVDLCNGFNLPLVFLVDVPGFTVGVDAEKMATMRYGMTAVMACVEASVPTVFVALRKAYGIAAGAFSCAGGINAFNLRLGWPSGEWGAIPIEGGVAAAYRREIESAPDPEAKRREIEERLVHLRSPFRAAEAGDVIDIVDPRDTRPVVCRFLKTAQPYLKKIAENYPKRSVRP